MGAGAWRARCWSRHYNVHVRPGAVCQRTRHSFGETACRSCTPCFFFRVSLACPSLSVVATPCPLTLQAFDSACQQVCVRAPLARASASDCRGRRGGGVCLQLVQTAQQNGEHNHASLRIAVAVFRSNPRLSLAQFDDLAKVANEQISGQLLLAHIAVVRCVPSPTKATWIVALASACSSPRVKISMSLVWVPRPRGVTRCSSLSLCRDADRAAWRTDTQAQYGLSSPPDIMVNATTVSPVMPEYWVVQVNYPRAPTALFRDLRVSQQNEAIRGAMVWIDGATAR